MKLTNCIRSWIKHGSSITRDSGEITLIASQKELREGITTSQNGLAAYQDKQVAG
jgi:hypothetical protein